MVQPIFQTGEIRGCRQIIGNASGGTHKTTIAIDDVRKYQGNGFVGGGILRVPSKNSPQCLHLMAASWISSAQNGQVFTKRLRLNHVMTGTSGGGVAPEDFGEGDAAKGGPDGLTDIRPDGVRHAIFRAGAEGVIIHAFNE